MPNGYYSPHYTSRTCSSKSLPAQSARIGRDALPRVHERGEEMEGSSDDERATAEQQFSQTKMQSVSHHPESPQKVILPCLYALSALEKMHAFDEDLISGNGVGFGSPCLIVSPANPIQNRTPHRFHHQTHASIKPERRCDHLVPPPGVSVTENSKSP